MEAPSGCIVCGARPVPALSRETLSLVRCPDCGLEWRDVFPDEAELSALYGGDYFRRWGIDRPGALERVRAAKRATYANVLETLHLPGGARLLDLGCALGFLLEEARDRGLDVWGVDRNAEAVRVARERFGDRVSGEPLDAAFPGVDFDAVTAIDVLEHVPDPALLLRTVAARLRPGGVFCALLPNVASATRRLFGKRWPHYVPEHLFHWSPRSLARFLAAQSWEVRGLRTGFRKTFTARYVAAYAAAVGSFTPPGLGALGDLRLRVPTGEMLVVAAPRAQGHS